MIFGYSNLVVADLYNLDTLTAEMYRGSEGQFHCKYCVLRQLHNISLAIIYVVILINQKD